MCNPKKLFRPSAVGALALSSLMATNAYSAIDPNDALHTLLTNGDFATTTAGWVNSNGWNAGNVMSVTTTSGAYCVAITQKLAIAARWDFALRQEGLKLQAGRTYTVKGKVWSSAAVPALYVGLDQTASPYAGYKNVTLVPTVSTTPITTNNLSMTYTHPTGSADVSGVHFGFQLGGLPLNTTVCFDDLAVVDPAYTVVVPQPLKTVLVNQQGYLTALNKLSTYVLPKTATDKTTARNWVLKQGTTQIATGKTVSSGATADAASGDFIHKIDFSTVTATGTGFTLEVTEGTTTHISRTFKIGNDIYTALKYDALAYFYHNRSGTPIDATVAGTAFARGAGHLYDNSLSTKDGLRSNVDVSGGWYDAGDHGKYVVNGGISVWTLLNQYERSKYLGANSSDFADGKMKLPATEKADGTPDLLNEARWEMEWMLKMQIPTGQTYAGMVYHKMHDDKWTDLTLNPATATAAANPRRIWGATTAATLNFAAVGAQCYRTFKTVDAVFAKKCLDKAVIAYTAAKATAFMAAPKTDPLLDGGGEYPDSNTQDESYWAATELYLATNDPAETVYSAATYAADMSASALHLQLPVAGKASMSWASTSGLGTMSLATAGTAFGANSTWVSSARSAISAQANTYATASETSFGTPFSSSAALPASWGSNSDVLNNIIVMGLARDFTCTSGTPDAKLTNAIQNSMNYIMGRNPMDYSYVTGYGSRAVSKPHHRFWNLISNVPAGVVVGGPNAGKEDPEAAANLVGCVSLKCYIDNVKAYSTNEVTVNWNSPLAWSAAYLDEVGSGRKPQACGGVNAQAGSINITTGTSGTLDLKVLNTGLATDTYTIVTQPTKGTVTITNGVASYVGGTSFTTSDSFTYKVTRAGVDSLVATVTITKTAPTTASCDTKVTIDTNIWNNSWQGQLAIQNTTAANLTSWSVDLEFDGTTKFGAWGGPGIYDADVQSLGANKYRLTNKAWNGNIAKGATLIMVITGTAGTQTNGTTSVPAAKPIISGTTCGMPLPKTVRLNGIHTSKILYGDGTNIDYFNSSSTPDKDLIFKIDSDIIPNFIYSQWCCRGALWLEPTYAFGYHTMTLTTGSTNPQETDTETFLFSNAKAECSISSYTQTTPTAWTASINVVNRGYHPGSLSRYNYDPAWPTDTVFLGKHWSVAIDWSEDYPGTGAREISRGVSNTDGKARVKEDLSMDGNNRPWYTYLFSAADFVGEIPGRAPNGQNASYSFNIKGTGTFLLPGAKKPQISCNFDIAPRF